MDLSPARPSSRASFSLSLVLPLTLVATQPAAGCGDDTGGSGGASAGQGGEGGVDDGKVHPDPSGVAIDEATACGAVLSAFQDRITALGCTGTSPSCPGLIQAPSGAPACSQYDEGTADGCATYVTEGADCDEVRIRLADCIVAPIEGSEPAGCP